jgi:DNA-3-methyladenine glycosylase I
MPQFTSYCEYCAAAPLEDPNRGYHDNEYGFPISSEEGLFEWLVLEINQAGLSWVTIVKKKGRVRAGIRRLRHRYGGRLRRG